MAETKVALNKKWISHNHFGPICKYLLYQFKHDTMKITQGSLEILLNLFKVVDNDNTRKNNFLSLLLKHWSEFVQADYLWFEETCFTLDYSWSFDESCLMEEGCCLAERGKFKKYAYHPTLYSLVFRVDDVMKNCGNFLSDTELNIVQKITEHQQKNIKCTLFIKRLVFFEKHSHSNEISLGDVMNNHDIYLSMSIDDLVSSGIINEDLVKIIFDDKPRHRRPKPSYFFK